MNDHPISANAGFDSNTVRSPCIAVCRMNPATELCEGCWRRIEEIAGWSDFSDDERRLVWQRIRERTGPNRPDNKDES